MEWIGCTGNCRGGWQGSYNVIAKEKLPHEGEEVVLVFVSFDSFDYCLLFQNRSLFLSHGESPLLFHVLTTLCFTF